MRKKSSPTNRSVGPKKRRRLCHQGVRIERLRVDDHALALEKLREGRVVGERGDLRPETIRGLRVRVLLLLLERALDGGALRRDLLHVAVSHLLEEERACREHARASGSLIARSVPPGRGERGVAPFLKRGARREGGGDHLEGHRDPGQVQGAGGVQGREGDDALFRTEIPAFADTSRSPSSREKVVVSTQSRSTRDPCGGRASSCSSGRRSSSSACWSG